MNDNNNNNNEIRQPFLSPENNNHLIQDQTTSQLESKPPTQFKPAKSILKSISPSYHNNITNNIKNQNYSTPNMETSNLNITVSDFPQA